MGPCEELLGECDEASRASSVAELRVGEAGAAVDRIDAGSYSSRIHRTRDVMFATPVTFGIAITAAQGVRSTVVAVEYG